MLLLFFTVTGWANNVRIVGDVRVAVENIVREQGQPMVATFSFTVEWDNSWRDEFNYDAVYVFLKHKVRGSGEKWYNVYLQDAGNTASSSGDEYVLELKNTTGTANRNEGFFLYRKENGCCISSVEVTLKWDIESTDRPDGLTLAHFDQRQVLMSAMAIEMVYVPRGAFRMGDTYSANHFRKRYLSLPEKYDIVPHAVRYGTTSTLGSVLYCDPQIAANQMNDLSADPDPVTGFPNNSWYGDGYGYGGYQGWSCVFAEPRAVRYVAIESVPGYVPSRWTLEGQSEGIEWKTIYTGTGADWETSLIRTYPPTRAIRVADLPELFTTYRIRVENSDMAGSNPPLIKNVAMSEVDLRAEVDNSVLINEPVTTLGTWMGLEAGDGDEWMGKTDENYPNGYPAFYAMKYEISQEQYVAFLNKLTIGQQRTRTIGGELEHLEEGEYVFGSDRKNPSNRNGIILLQQTAGGEPAVFEAKIEPGRSDGTLACNYLSPEDMLAYADWSGLRPMTEMEYEKMNRPFFPTESVRGGYPWGGYPGGPPALDIREVTVLYDPATRRERPSNPSANVNFNQTVTGPVRSGAFLTGTSRREQTGAGFWGAMEGAGNLQEICYNVNSEGRLYRGLATTLHGNGYLDANGNTDITIRNWPLHHNAFILKGGHWADTEEKYLAVSDRSRHQNYYTSMKTARRDSTVSFRLAHTAPKRSLVTHISLENGLSTANTGGVSTAADTVCHRDIYTIRGTLPPEMADKLYTVVWYKSENGGVSWESVEGAGDQNLTVRKLWNMHTGEDRVIEYWFRKEIYGETTDAKSDVVVLRILNTHTSLSRKTDTLDVYDRSLGVKVNVEMKASFAWLFDGKAVDVAYDVLPGKPGKAVVGAPLYSSLSGADTEYVIRSRFMNHCTVYDTVSVYRRPTPPILLSDAANWNEGCGSFMQDARDNKIYRTVKIGMQCWMADNLNYVEIGSRCYENKAENCEKYGRLYNWKQAIGEWYDVMWVRGVCPAGWHVPNHNEWLLLGQDVPSGRAWRSQLNLWNAPTQLVNGSFEPNLATNSSGFSALPGGGYFFSYSTSTATSSDQLKRLTGFYDLRDRAWWWSSTGTSSSFVTGNSTANAITTIPMLATVNSENTITLQNPASSAISTPFYGPVDYLGNATSLNEDARYHASVAIQNNFYFSVRCLKD